jgi:hypothetical protein
MRYRLVQPWLFALLLICMQQFALLHPYTHIADWQKTATHQPSNNQKDNLPHSQSCAQCLAIAGIDSAVASKALAIHNVSDVFVFCTTLPSSFVVAYFQAYLSRAPPSLT